MKTYAFRLHPGMDLRQELVRFAAEKQLKAAFVMTCVGSLQRANLRLANKPTATVYEDKFEIDSLVGTLSLDGPHLHITLSDSNGNVIGGHVFDGCLIYTTAEIVLGELEDVSFRRTVDPKTAYDELIISPK
jgi:uncharacterized protein